MIKQSLRNRRSKQSSSGIFPQLGVFVTESVTLRIIMSQVLRRNGVLASKAMHSLIVHNVCTTTIFKEDEDFQTFFSILYYFITAVYFFAQYKQVANIKEPLVKSNDFAILSNFIWSLSDNCLIARFWYIANSEHLKNSVTSS